MRHAHVFLIGVLSLGMSPWAQASVLVNPTMNPGDLQAALGGTGMTINSVTLLNGAVGQYGTYTNYTAQPITIGDGVVLSSGNVGFLGPPADPSLESPQPSYDMETPGTAEFDAYGPGKIENFQSSNDVAVLRVDFSLDDTSQVQFDFVFGSVEYPFYTGSFTDSFLVFLNGTDPTNQQSVFRAVAIDHAPALVTIPTLSGRTYRIWFADAALAPLWTPFGNASHGFGAWLETNPPTATHIFVDDYSTNTSGALPPQGARFYRVDVMLTP